MIVLPFICSMPDGATVDNVHLLGSKDPKCMYYSNSSAEWIRIGAPFNCEREVNAVIAMYSNSEEANKATSLRALQMACRWAAVSGKLLYMSTMVHIICNIDSQETADKANLYIDTLKAAGEYARIKAGRWLEMHLAIPVAVTYMEGIQYRWQREWVDSCKEGAVPYVAGGVKWQSNQQVILFNSFYYGQTERDVAKA